MNVEIKVPSLGESVSEARIGTLLKASGTTVRVDEEIIELETDKVNQVLYAPASGTLRFTVNVGDTVSIGQTIGFIETGGAAKAPATAKHTEAAKPTDSGRVTRKKMSSLRRIIAQKLVEVKNQTAMLTTFNEVDMSAIISLREQEQENFQRSHGVKLGFMSFFIQACALALKEYPDINGRIEGDEIVYNNYYDIGIAVSTEKGLMVPVLRNADRMNHAAIEKALKAYAEKARAGTISADDLHGGTFTITNGGVFGSLLSTPILNPPQSGILGMHNIVKRPVAIDDQVVIRPMMYLALSYDHRIVDGKESIGFLIHLKKTLENPSL